MLEQENSFYELHQTEFREKYLDKWLVITGETLWGVYDKIADAARDAFKHLEPGKIMIHRPADDGKIIEIPSVCAKHHESKKKPKLRREIVYSSGNLIKYTYPY